MNDSKNILWQRMIFHLQSHLRSFHQTSPSLHFIYLHHERTDMAPTKLQAVPLPQPGNIFP